MSVYNTIGECVHCHLIRKIRSRGLCNPCYKHPEIRAKYPSQHDDTPEGGEVMYLLDTGEDPCSAKALTLKELVAKAEKQALHSCVVWRRYGHNLKKTYTIAAVKVEGRWTHIEMQAPVTPIL